MSIAHKWADKVTSDSTQSLGGSASEVGATEAVIDLTIAASQTNQLCTLAFTAADVQSVALLSSTDLVIKTNSTGSPANTINLKAGRLLTWRASDGYFTCPFTANVTAFYLTNGAATTNFQARILVN